MLARFQWWRRLRGGRWARCTGLVWGLNWIRVTDACAEAVEEDWR